MTDPGCIESPGEAKSTMRGVLTHEPVRDCAYALSIVALSWPLWIGVLDARQLRGQDVGSAALSGKPLALCSLFVLPIGFALILRVRHWPSPGWRIAAMAAAAPLAWTFSTYAENPVLGGSRTFDRVLVLALLCLIWVHPAVIGAFLAVVSAVGAQFDYPLGGYTWVDKHLPLSVLAVLLAAAMLSPLAPKRGHVVAICVGGVTVSPYFVAGIAKIPMGWHENDLGNLFASSYVNGWLADLSESTVTDVANVLSFFSPAIVLLTLIVEVGAVGLLVTRRGSIPVLIALLALHATIYLSSGILFWKWGVALLGLAALLRSRDSQRLWAIEGRHRVALSLLAVVAGVAVFNPTPLAWRDSGLTQAFDLDVVYDDGSTAQVPRTALKPYVILFAQNRLFRASTVPRVVGTYGTVGTAARADLINEAGVDSVAHLSASVGEQRFAPEWARAFDLLVRSLLTSEQRGGLPLLPSPPRHIQSQAGDADWRDRGRPVAALLRLRVVVRTSDGLVTVSDEVVRRIAL